MYRPSKRSARYYAKHHEDIYTDLGFEYKGRIFEKTLSPIILENAVNKSLLSRIENLIFDSIEDVKQIRTHYMISVDKNDTNVN